MIDLTGHQVLVTGGSRGIGAACCRLFGRAGAAVWVCYGSRAEMAEEVLEELREISDAPHEMAGADLTDAGEVAALFRRVEARWGRLDCLVNNAGVWLEDPLDRFSEESYERTMDVNVRGPFLCMRAALPLLEASPWANVVNVTSTAGQRGEAEHSPYAASKGAMIAATKSWAVELAPIRVNSVAPGWVETEMTAAALDAGARAAALEEIPLSRIALPEDVAGPVLFLASPLARHVTAAVVNVNGGSVR